MITFENGLEREKIWKRHCYNNIVVDRFQLKCKLLKTMQQQPQIIQILLTCKQ